MPAPPRPTPRESTVPYVAVDQRVQRIYRWLRDGLNRHAIMQQAAIEAAQERDARIIAERQRAALKEEGGDPEIIKLPAVVWGNQGKAPATRTLDAYIRRAKERYVEEAAETAAQRQWVFGLQVSRLNILLNQALTPKQNAAKLDASQIKLALEINQEINKLHGLYGQALDLSQPIPLSELQGLLRNLATVVQEEVTDDAVLLRISERWESLFRASLIEFGPPLPPKPSEPPIPDQRALQSPAVSDS